MSLRKTLWKPIISGVLVFLVIIASFQIATNMHPPVNKQSYTNISTPTTQTSPSQGAESLALINNNGILSFNNLKTLKLLLNRYIELSTPSIIPQYGYPYYGLLYGVKALEGTVTQNPPPGTTTTMATTTAGSMEVSTGTGYSQTNVQVQGIDEEDIAKTNGEYIALLSRNGTLILYKAYPPEELNRVYAIGLQEFIGKYNPGTNLSIAIIQGSNIIKVLGQIRLLYVNPKGLYITNESVIAIITGIYGISNTYQHNMYAQQYAIPIKTVTWVLKLDFSGNLVKTYWVDGDMVSARYAMATKNIVLVTKEQTVSLLGGAPIEPETVNGPIDPQNVYLLGPPNSYTILTWLNTDDWTERSAAILGDEATTVYMPSPDTLYLTARSFESMVIILKNLGMEPAIQHTITTASGPTEIPIKVVETVTTTNPEEEVIVKLPYQRLPYENNFTLIKAKLENDKIWIVAKANITGFVSNQWQIDEYNGMLRLVTYNFEKRSVSLQILNATTLQPISKLGDIAVNERIHAVRFIGDRLYVVTYRNIDPLFYINLSNPEKPEVIGYLKAPGFDEYMHPVNSTLLIGVGRGDEWHKLRISTYKIESNGTIRVLSRLVIDYSWSPVLNAQEGYKTFVFYKEKGLIVIPVQSSYWKKIYLGLALIKIDENTGKLKLLKILNLFSGNSTSIPQKTYDVVYRAMNRVRGLYIDDVLYMVNSEIEPYVVAYNLTDLTQIMSS